MKRIVITGGTGFLGKHLIRGLQDSYTMIVLTRNPSKYTNTDKVFYEGWNEGNTIENILDGAYAVINLAGENIGSKKWTKEQKEKILSSRIKAAQTIKKSIELCKNAPEIWVQASASGYYGTKGKSLYNEESPKGTGFLSDVCYEWEKPIHEIDFKGRKIIIRTGVVLSSDSALLKQLTMSFKFGVKAVPGDGTDYLPWIHVQDEIRAIHFLLDNKECSGIFNLAAPKSSSMEEIIKEIGKYKKSLISLHIPAWFLQLIFGKEMTKEIILTNQKVYPQKLLEMGFHFKYDTIQDAVSQMM